MKIVINQVPAEGLYLKEQIGPAELDLDTDLIKFRSPVEVEGKATRITNALTVDLKIKGEFFAECSRCLSEFKTGFEKNAQFNYSLESSDVFIELNPQIREEIILDYPIKLLCNLKCKGLCSNCGKNKNEGGCNCAIT